MKLDNFTTAKCNKCGWVRQFKPDTNYKAEDFRCNCKEAQPIFEKTELLIKAKSLGLKVPNNIGLENLKKKIKEVENGRR